MEQLIHWWVVQTTTGLLALFVSQTLGWLVELQVFELDGAILAADLYLTRCIYKAWDPSHIRVLGFKTC